MNILTFDIEDWFHLLDNEYTKGVNQWKSFDSRVEIGLEKIFDILQECNVSATIFEKAGAPYYYIGNSYLKIGDKDFDLIIESYEKALALELSIDLREQVIQAREHISMREKKLKDFWK